MRFLLLCVLLISCGIGDSPLGELKESWDEVDTPEIFGVDTLKYEDLQKDEHLIGLMPEKPWSDSYWPLENIGLADRWIDSQKAAPFEFESDVYEDDDNIYGQEAIRDIKNALSNTREMLDKSWEESLYVSPAEKYDLIFGLGDFPLTKYELIEYANNRRSYEKNDIPWGWMGSCHGWAPASLLFDPPKHAVLAKNIDNDNEMLFTEGDIRALVTKAAADNRFEVNSKTIGSRCNDGDIDIVRDSNGRIVDGVLGFWEEDEEDPEAFKFSDSLNIRIYSNNWFNHAELASDNVELVFSFYNQADPEKKYWLTVIDWHPNGRRDRVFNAELYTTKTGDEGRIFKDRVIASGNANRLGCLLNEYGNCINSPSDSDREAANILWSDVWFGYFQPRSNDTYLAFKYYKSCRDINAGTFHLVLTQFLSGLMDGGEAKGFVLDITRDDQVWNHPTYAQRTRIGDLTPIRINEGNTEYVDAFLKVRAPGTKYIVDVYTQLFFGVENGPLLKYAEDDNHITMKNYHYTLELNEHQEVIGGEWHIMEAFRDPELDATAQFRLMVPKSGVQLLTSLEEMIEKRRYHIDPITSEFILHKTPDFPDFLWAVEPGAKLGKGNVINSDYVMKLLECSQSEPTSLLNAQISTSVCEMELFEDPDSEVGAELFEVCSKKTIDIPYSECQVSTNRAEFRTSADLQGETIRLLE